MFLANLLHILGTLTLIAYVGRSLLPQFRVDGQSIDEYHNAMPFSVPLYYRERPVIVERPIILRQPMVPETNAAFQPDDYLTDKAIFTSAYRPNPLPFDRDLEYSTGERRKRRRRRRRKRRRRRYG